MNKLKNPVLLGKIGAPHSVHGELRVSSFTDDPMALGDYGVLQSKDGKQFTVKKARPSKNVLVVRFKEIQTRNDAEAVRGLELFVERDMLGSDAGEDEFFVDDLIGMQVQVADESNDNGETNSEIIGRIQAVPNFGAGDLLEIAPIKAGGRVGSNTWYLAFTQENVPEIDFDRKMLKIVIPTQISERDE